MENESKKKEIELEEGEINSETEMEKISEGNEVREFEIDGIIYKAPEPLERADPIPKFTV